MVLSELLSRQPQGASTSGSAVCCQLESCFKTCSPAFAAPLQGENKAGGGGVRGLQRSRARSHPGAVQSQRPCCCNWGSSCSLRAAKCTNNDLICSFLTLQQEILHLLTVVLKVLGSCPMWRILEVDGVNVDTDNKGFTCV